MNTIRVYLKKLRTRIMTGQESVDTVGTKVAGTEAADESTNDSFTLEDLLLLVTTNKVSSLEEETKKELQGLRQRQRTVTFLHKLLRALNLAADSKGNLDLKKSEELQELLAEAKELGIEVDPSKMKYSREERERLVENIRMACDDLNMENDMQIQTVTRLTNERYEAFQLARSIMKPLHEDKINKARALAGR